MKRSAYVNCSHVAMKEKPLKLARDRKVRVRVSSRF